jgi:senataxin
LGEKDEADRKKKVEKAVGRKETVLNALPVFAFDGPDVVPFQEYLEQELAKLMAKCDVCVRVFHTARRELKHNLESVYDPEEVEAFMTRFDGINIDRINGGLAYATKELLNLPPELRRITQLSPRSIYGIFEVLSCEPYFLNDQLLSKHFDQPFELVQTKRRLRISNYIPALTAFLFSENKLRFEWAVVMWGKLNRPPIPVEFDADIRPYFLEAMKKVHVSALQVHFLPSFWNGARTIISHLNKELITHSLRSMDIDVYKLMLGHFYLAELDIAALGDMLATFKFLLEISPTDFWDAMKSISAATVIEQVFNSPCLDRILLRNGEEGVPSFKDIFSWVEPFLDSIKPRNQTPACRSLVNQLIARSQNTKYPEVTRSNCLTQALKVLLHTLNNLNKGNKPSTFVGAANVADVLELVNQYVDTILARTRGAENGKPWSTDTGLALQVIERSLMLDSLALVMDMDTVLRQKEREKANDIKSESLWNTIAKSIKPGNQALATHALLGAQKLLSVEQFGPKFVSVSPKDPPLFNAAYDAKWGFVCNILERLSSFSPFQLAGLFKTPQTASGVIATLLSPHNATRQAALEMLEQLSGNVGRRDAIAHLLGQAYLSTLSAINGYIVQVTHKKLFSPVSSMIKLCMDVVDVLTNTQDGILRARDLDDDEVRATEGFWKNIWQALVTVFDMTETWSNRGHDKTVMMDFCRDTMQFTESLFDGYSVFVSAIRSELREEEENREHAIQLLRLPRDAMDSMVLWLRLRDEYLADKIVKVVANLLVKLRKAHIEVQEQTLKAILNVTDGTTRTKLSFSHMNELRQALEKHTGKAIAPSRKDEPKVSKQSSISAWATSGRSGDVSSDQSDVVTENTRNHERMKKILKQREHQAAVMAARKPSNVIDQEVFKNRRLKELEEKKKRDAAAIARANQLRGDLAGAGSALGAMGIKGKDHSAPKGTGIMLSSDEDSDPDDDSLDEELFGMTKTVKSEKKTLPNGMPSRMIPEPRKPVTIKRQVRSFKDMRARLAPDLSSLHKEMLSWDYFHTGDFPPGSRQDQYSAVPNVFRDPVSYANTFKPLLILEAWQGLVKAREENSARPYDVKIVTRSTVDSFVEVSTTLTHAENMEVSISEGDIVLVSKANNPANASSEPHCLARVQKVSRKKQFLEVLYRVVPGNKFISSLNPNGVVRGIKVQSMTTLEREYGALVGLKYYDLCDWILKAKPSELLSYNDKHLDPLISTYKLNKAQAKAVKSAMDNDAFTLIQG